MEDRNTNKRWDMKPEGQHGRRRGIALLLAAACLVAPLVLGSPAGASTVASVGGSDSATCHASGDADLEKNTCPGIRPGGIIRTPHSSYCTMNFVFTDDRGHTYIGTAGHCVADVPFMTKWRRGKGPVASDFDGKRIGEFVFAMTLEKDGRSAFDFALARLDRGVKAEPKMCGFNGPTGINNERTELSPIQLNFYGHGQGISEAQPARTAIANGTPDPLTVFAWGPGMLGDSGSGVLDSSGRAIGIFSTIGFHSDPNYDQNAHFGTIGIVRLAPQMRLAERELGIDLTLETVSE